MAPSLFAVDASVFLTGVGLPSKLFPNDLRIRQFVRCENKFKYFENFIFFQVRILEALNPHEHIVPMIEALSDQFHYYIVLELLEGGELLQRLRRMEKFTEIQVEKE